MVHLLLRPACLFTAAHSDLELSAGCSSLVSGPSQFRSTLPARPQTGLRLRLRGTASVPACEVASDDQEHELT